MHNKSIHVLMVLSDLRVANGVTSFAMNYYRNLDFDKIQMDFAIYFDGESPYYDEIKARGGKVFLLPSVKHPIKHVVNCLRILTDGTYDVIHDNSLIITLPMMWCAKLKRVPVRILHSHNSKLGETKKKEIRNKLFLPLLKATATDYAACSKLAGQAMFDKRKFTVIPNVIVTERYKYSEQRRNEVRKQMGADDKYIIGTVGRVAYQKNPFFAMDVFAEVLKKEPKAEYWWVGSGPLQQELAEYVEKKGLSEHVKLLGSREDVIDLYQAMDCFFLPSLFEGLPVTGVEAQAMGLPCVISDTVTEEMVYTDMVEFVSFEKSTKEWSYRLIDKVKYIRNNISHITSDGVFSDKIAGANLLQAYKHMMNRNILS